MKKAAPAPKAFHCSRCNHRLAGRSDDGHCEPCRMILLSQKFDGFAKELRAEALSLLKLRMGL